MAFTDYDVEERVNKLVITLLNAISIVKCIDRLESCSCFDDKLKFIRSIYLLPQPQGGSWISTGAESSRFARFAFRRHFFQHLGFRLVRSCEATPVKLCTPEVFVLGAGVSGKSQNGIAMVDNII